jgi:hypothetical protein
VVKAGGTQSTTNLQEWQNSLGTLLAKVESNGKFYVGDLESFGSVGVGLTPYVGSFLFALSTGDANNKGILVRGADSQSANLQEWQNSLGAELASINSAGYFTATGGYVLSNSGGSFERAFGGAFLGMAKATSAPTNPGANSARVYFRDGTVPGTLKLVVRAGDSGVEETLFDNLDQAGTSTIAIGSGVRATDATVATAANGVGYMGLPQNSTTTGSYTIVAGDAGKHIYASATRTVTIPANSALALPIGTTLTFIAGAGATMTIAITTNTMYLAGAGTTGSRTLAAHGIATAVKTTATTWLISGNGLT